MVAAFLLALSVSSVTVEMPAQLNLEPVSAQELAGGTAVTWEGGASPSVPVVVRRVPGAFRLLVPRGVALSSLDVAVTLEDQEFRGGGFLRGQDGTQRVPVRVTVLPLRLLGERGNLEVWEGDLLLHLDVSGVLAGEFQGKLRVTVAGR